MSEHNPEAYKVGALWATSWGYDQTNVEHYEVVRETPGTVTLRRIASEWRDGRSYPMPGVYIRDRLLDGNAEQYDRATGEWVPSPRYVEAERLGYSEKVCRKPRPSKYGGAIYDHLTIDDVRSAWPTTADEGHYDTAAAGLPGH